MTKAAEEGKLDPVVGRVKEIERLAQILSRRKKNNSLLQTAGAGILADHSCSDRGDCREGGSGVKLQRALRNTEYYHIPRHGQLCIDPHSHGIWSGKCVQSYGILPAVCTLYGYDRDDPKRSGKQKDHA